MFTSTRKVSQKLGTPTKKRKIDIFSQQEFLGDLGLKKKKSLIDCFQFVGAIHSKHTSNLPLLRKQSMNRIQGVQVNGFEMDEEDEMMRWGMDAENKDEKKQDVSEEQEVYQEPKLVKRITMQDIQSCYKIPQLYRCNSGIQIDADINLADETKYGDNIYIEQINQLRRLTSKRSKQNNPNSSNLPSLSTLPQKPQRPSSPSSSSCSIDPQQRFLQDYQISNSIHAYVRNHQNYICLNKLDRIFYYIKKINLPQITPKPIQNQWKQQNNKFNKFTQFTQYNDDEEDNENQLQIYQLIQQQIRLYNRDQQGNLVRFYQSWEEDNSIFMVFEIANTSLQEKTAGSIKMREKQVWQIVSQCCKGLEWMGSQGEFHLNIKPGNILKCRDQYKLSDPLINCQNLQAALNMFKGEEQEEQKLRIAFNYCAPEIIEYRSFIQGLQFEKCDIFSLGLCILENITGLAVNILKQHLKLIRTNSEKYLKGYSPALRNLLIRMISLDPSKRPTAQQIANQQFQILSKSNQIQKNNNKKRKMSI